MSPRKKSETLYEVWFLTDPKHVTLAGDPPNTWINPKTYKTLRGATKYVAGKMEQFHLDVQRFQVKTRRREQ